MSSKSRTLLLALVVAAVLLPVQAAFGRVDRAGGGGASAGSRIVPGKWVVALDAPIDAPARRALRAAGVRVERVSRDRLRAVVASATPQAGARERLAALGDVEWVEPVSIHRAALEPTDPSYLMQWGLTGSHSVSAEQAWDTTTGASAVTIAVVDSGIDLEHPEFAGRVAPAGFDFANDDAVPQDDNGHGTHVSGIAAAAMNNGVGGTGVAPRCTILPVKVLAANGEGYNFDIAEGIRWATTQGADVINISIEGGYSTDIANAVADAQAADVVVVAAVGNDAGSVAYPARLPGVVGVSAVDSAWQLASFSNHGVGVDIAAPGVTIWSTWLGGTMSHQQGTSMAAPFVTGVAALMRCVNPALTQDQVTSRLMASASDIGAPSTDTSYGAGLLHASRAVAYAVALTDDDIPGASAPVSPVSGTLHAVDDLHDVHGVSLIAGEGLVATVTADAGTDFDLHVYAPSAQHVTGGDVPLVSSAGSAYPKTVSFVATDTGVYYLDVAAAAGAGDYTLEYAKVPDDPADDDVPGVDLPASPVLGTLAVGFDSEDVFRVEMEPGYRLEVDLTAHASTDFDVYLFLPEATTVAHKIPPAVAWSEGYSYPEQFVYTAKRAGTYYLDISAYDGSGPYTLTWSIVKTTPQPDDDIPGVALTASPATGQLAADYDVDDVRYLDLDVGQEVTATLTGPGGTDFDLYLYGPGARHVVPPDEPLVSAAHEGSSEIVTYTAPVAGRYYLDARAYSGSGGYTLSWQRGTGPADGALPGVALPASPVSRLLGVASDPDDVFAVELAEGQQLDISVEPSAGLDTDLYLYGPDATALASDTAVASYWHGAAERITYIAPQAGTYRIDVRARSGSGLYSLTHVVGSATASVTALSLAAEQPVGGRSVTLTATLTAGDGAPVAGRTLVFEADTGGVWAAVATSTTGADGVATATVSSTALRFRARHSGDAQTAAATAAPAPIAARAESVVRLAASATAPSYLGAVTLTAHVSEAGTSTLLTGPLTIEQLTGAGWTAVPASVTSTGTASVTVRLATATTYRAVFGGTDSHHPSVSASIVVKPKAAVSNPVAPLSMYRTRYYTVYGSLRPRHTAGTYPVRIYRYRYSSGRWVSYGYVLAKAYNYSTYTKYARSIRLPYTGTWRLRAYAPADSGHSAVWSAGYDTVRVR